MKGLLNAQRGEMQGGAIPSQDVFGQMGMDEQEQAMVEKYIAHGMKIIHAPETRDKVIKVFESGLEPPDALASAAEKVVTMVDQAITNNGTAAPASDPVRFLGGFALLNQLAEVGDAAGKFKIDQDILMQAFSLLLSGQMERGLKEGKYTAEELKAAGEQAAEQTGINPAAGEAQLREPGVSQ